MFLYVEERPALFLYVEERPAMFLYVEKTSYASICRGKDQLCFYM